MDNTYTPLVTDERMKAQLKELLPQFSDALDVAAACGDMNRSLRDTYEKDRRQTHAELAELRAEVDRMREVGDAMRDELQKKVVLDRLTNDKFPGSAECAISRWTQAKVSSLPVADGEKERSGPSVEEVMEALRLAIKYIKESPCDPDIYDEQIKAWLALNDNPIAAELLSQER